VTLHIDRRARCLWRSDGAIFDPVRREWVRAAARSLHGARVSPVRAVAWLQTESGTPCRVPIAIIGARAARDDQLAVAESAGEAIARIGLTVICGGREGIMEAACQGVERGGGLSIGLLPDDSPMAANPYVSVPIATGNGVARNAIIARAALCLLAIGGGYGTTSEAALGLQLGKPVFVLRGGPRLKGVKPCRSVATARAAISRVVLQIPG